jgi:superfamily II DNA or RNA helicase
MSSRTRVKPIRGQKTVTKQPKLSRLHKPENLSLEDWQRELRRQFGRDQAFGIKNQGDHDFFSEFQITNPESKSTYRVIIRGPRSGDNFCSCGDFATNTLGTCKHIEFTLASLERKRGGKAALEAGFQPAYSEVLLQYGAQREVRFRPGSECPVALARLAAKYFGPEGTLLPDAFARFEIFLNEAGKLDHDLRCREDVLEFVAEMRDRERRQEILRQAFPKGAESAAMKTLVNVPLYDYQAEGALFAARAGRCLLGDEMGLGKTIQAIAAAEIMARHFGVERVLIICPTSLKYQWQREIERFTGRAVQVIGGMRGERAAEFRKDSFFKILNYDTVHTDLHLIEGWAPDLVILDEAQRIKNWSTRVARSVKQIASPYAIVLTGTPLENRLEELVSIVQFVDRFRLGPTFRLLDEHQVRDEAGKVVGYRHLDRIGQTLGPVLLRRLKDNVLEQLPQRLDKNFFVPMTPQQRELHEENREIVSRIVHRWRKYKFLSEADQRRLMIALQNMRMSCDSTYLLDQSTKFGVKVDELVTLLQELFEKPDTKVVLFSQWLRMHQVIQPRLRDNRWDHVLFHGGVPGHKRKDLVDRFRDDPDCRLFLATDAGGVGLNLQFASVVINMDLPWNPAVLEQRIGRVHRLGQRRPVQVVNFVAQGTIEEGMLGVLKFKKSLFAGVLDGGEKEVFLGGSRLTKFMESVEKTTSTIPPADQQAERQEPERPRPQVGIERTGGDNPLAKLLEQGAGLLAGFGAVLKAPAAANPFIGQDERTGEKFLKLPMPGPEVLETALMALGDLLRVFGK